MSSPRKLYFYPPGGRFNKKRLKQPFIQNLLQEKAVAYSQTKQDKQEWVNEHILVHFPGGCFEAADNGKFQRVNDDYAYRQLAQKLRDRLKAIRKKAAEAAAGYTVLPPAKKSMCLRFASDFFTPFRFTHFLLVQLQRVLGSLLQ